MFPALHLGSGDLGAPARIDPPSRRVVGGEPVPADGTEATCSEMRLRQRG